MGRLVGVRGGWSKFGEVSGLWEGRWGFGEADGGLGRLVGMWGGWWGCREAGGGLGRL